MAEDFEIRRVYKENFKDLIMLIHELAKYEKLAGPDKAAEKRLWDDMQGTAPRFYAYLGYTGGKPVAYLFTLFTYSSFLAKPTFYIEDIFILEQHRRKGFGHRLFMFCAKQAKLANCGRMEWTVLDWNEPAKNFYMKHKATIMKEWQLCRMTEKDLDTLIREETRK